MKEGLGSFFYNLLRTSSEDKGTFFFNICKINCKLVRFSLFLYYGSLFITKGKFINHTKLPRLMPHALG